MGLAFRLTLPANTNKFPSVGEIPALTAKAIHPESENDSDTWAFCQINHEAALDRAIKAGMVTPLNPLSFERHTFPFGDALRRAVISLDDFKRFAASLQIEVVTWDEPTPTQDDMAGTRTHLTIREAASALAEKYGFNENTMNTMREQLSAAAEREDVTVRHPQTLLPYRPDTRRDFYELVSLSDLNTWLKTQGSEYQLDDTEQAQHELRDEQTQDQELAPHEYTAEQQALFDPLSQAGIAELFNIAGMEWSNLFGRAARNDLYLAREGSSRPHQYNPARVASWLVRRGNLKQAHANSRLAKNLPPRSQNFEYLITGDLPD